MKNKVNILVLLLNISFFILSSCTKNEPAPSGQKEESGTEKVQKEETGAGDDTKDTDGKTKDGDAQPSSKKSGAKIAFTQDCTCSGEKVAVDPTTLMGKTFPMISDTNPPSYFEISSEDQIGTFVGGANVEKVLTENDEVFELNKDMTISTNQNCDVGIYTASYTEEIRQNVQVCGNEGGGSCTMLDIEQTMINTSLLLKRKEYNACPWEELQDKHWKMYAFNADGQFSHVNESKAFGLLDIHFEKGSASLALSNINPSMEPITFENIQPGKALQAEKDNMKVSLHTHTMDGQKTTHILGAATLGEKAYLLVGLPNLKYVGPVDFSIIPE